MIRSLLTLPAVFFLSFLVSPLSAADDTATTGTLRLGDIFDLRPGVERLPLVTNRRPRVAANLIVPDSSLWKSPPPTPTPTPPPIPVLLEGMTELPRIPSLLEVSMRERRPAETPAFRDRGRGNIEQVPPGDFTLLTIFTDSNRLNAEYRLIPVETPGEEDDRKPLRFFHTPGTKESFTIPSGLYRLERRLWIGNDLSRQSFELYKEQLLYRGSMYDFVADEPNEARIIDQRLKNVGGD